MEENMILELLTERKQRDGNVYFIRLYTDDEYELLHKALMLEIEYAVFILVQDDFQDAPLSWDEYLSLVQRSEEIRKKLRALLQKAINDFPLVQFTFGAELEEKNYPELPADENGICSIVELFENPDKCYELINTFILKAQGSYFLQKYMDQTKTYSMQESIALANEFMTELLFNQEMRREIRRSIHIHLSSLDFSEMDDDWETQLE